MQKKEENTFGCGHYWVEPVTIAGIKIHLTPAGCDFYIEHYKCLLKQEKNKEHHHHIRRLLANCKQYLELYKNTN